MALTDNPYLPLYVKDWMTSNKLKLCSANAHGIMINVMCLMHRQNEYGTILLKQNFKQTTNQILNFACLLAKLTPFSEKEISAGLTELIEEKCLIIDGDFLKCLRMINDAKLSEIRKSVGKKGGDETAKKFALPKDEANPGNENAGEIETNTKETHQIFADRLLLNELELEAVTESKRKLTPELIKQFHANCITSSKKHDHYSEYKRHLANWLRKQPIDQPTRTRKILKDD